MRNTEMTNSLEGNMNFPKQLIAEALPVIERSLKMKLHTLTALVLGAVASHVAFAGSEADSQQPQEPKVIHAFGLSAPVKPAEPDSAYVIHAFGLSVPGKVARPDSDGIHAFGLNNRGDSDRKSAQTGRDKPGS
jgi:hypothetical protein